jgi:hypothetical protein
MILPQDAKNFGYFLEHKLLESMKELDIFDEIYVEDHLKKQWGWSASGVDQMLVIGDYVIAIQAKWRGTRRRETVFVNNFLSSLEYTLAKCGKKLLFGLWVSRLEPFDDNKEKLNERKVMIVSHFDSIDRLVELTREVIKERILIMQNKNI